MPKGDKPTLKMRMFAKKYIEYKGNGAKAALEVYDTNKRDAKNVAHITLKKPIVQKEIKELLTKKGLDLDNLTDYTKNAIVNNLTYGKASQAVGADLLKFMYRLHNVVPGKEVRTVKEERKIVLSHDFNTVKEQLSTTISRSQELLKDLE